MSTKRRRLDPAAAISGNRNKDGNVKCWVSTMCFLAALLAIVLAGCGGKETGHASPTNPTNGAAPDTTPPTITATTPGNNVTGVPFNQAIAATFSEAMNPASVTTAGFTLTGPGGAAVPGTIAYVPSGSTATFTPSSPLAAGSLFTATITTKATDLAGNALAANHVWSFTTGAAPDTTPPTITATNPANNVTGVPFNQAIAATFSEGMNPASVTHAGFTLTGPGGAAVPGTIAYVVSGSTATFTPSSPLAAGSLFTATITTAVTDLAGNRLAANYIWSFTTGTAPDTTPPTITATNPANNVTGVPFNQAIAATFSKGMNPLSVTNAGFTLTGPGGAAVAGTAAYVVSGSTATFTPSSPLAAGTLFTATITTAAADLAGNALTANYVWSFTTGSAPDTTPPTITATNPASVTGVPFNQAVAVTFSEGMNPLSVTNAGFTLTGPGGTAVAGTVAYVVSGSTATFTPSSPLAASSTFTATITTAATDLAGNAMAADYVWSFTTGAAPNTTPPTITATNPASSASGVPFNQAVAATFSEGMNPLSVTNAGFTLTGPGGAAVAGTVAYVVSGSTATFTPSSPLAAGTLFTATITTAATDLAGNALAANHVWSFTTGSAPDTTPPTITATNPANSALGVPFNQAIAATFSKGMNPQSVNNAGFTLTGPGGVAVPGTVTYVVSGSTATFTPSSPLAAGSLFTATITDAVTDLAGTASVANYVWSFTTGTAPDASPPTLTATNPANNVTGVPFNQAIVATFSEGMNPLAVINAGFTLTGPGGAAVPGTVTYVVSGSTATFTPSSPLAAGSLFTATITTAATDLAGNALAANYVWSFTTGAAPDTTPPVITATNPANNVTGVPFNQAIAATFSKGMNSASVTNAGFTLTGPGGGAVAGTVTYVVSGSTATFTPSSPLAAGSLFTATITTAATDLAGNALAANYVWSFSTGAAPDTTPPTITATNPANNVTGVPFNQAIAATFSEGMNPLAVINAGFTLTGPGGAAVPGTVTYVVSGSTATFTPFSPLAAGSLFTATITTAATDLAGNALAANYVWSFTTGAAPDTTPPVITATNPANNVTGVPFNQAIAATFSKGMNPASVTTAGFTLAGPGGGAVAGTVAYVVSGSTATFTPSSPLAAGSLFTATITTTATDLAGNALAASHVWSFTTGAAPDTTPPVITATNPANNVTGIPLNQAIAATFSKGMNPASVTTAGFTLTGPGGGAVAGTVTYVVSGSTATFTPSSPLAAGSLFTATITTAATDLAGNALAVNHVWTFTTGAAPDTTRPTLTATNPANNVTGVPFNQAIAATFSKGMNPASVTTAGFNLTGPGGAAVAGTIAYVVSGSTATFTPSSSLAAGSLFTATITTAATDLAGNALAANYVWSFTTGAAPDTTPPVITATNPANNVTGIPFNQAIAATFSKGMNPASVTNTGFTLTGPGGGAVAGTVTYVVSGSTATFTPSSPLAAGSLFTATITTAAIDLAGNALAANHVWSFTTGAAPDTTRPTLTATNPANNVTGVPFNQAIAATFSEGMNPASVTTAGFTLTGPGGAAVPGTIAYVVSGSTATFTPSSSLAAGSLFTATITTAATDLAGNALAANYVWSFTTGAAPDTTPPAITATNPANNVTGVPFNQAIAATFSKGMNPASVTNGGFTLAGPGGAAVAGTVTYVVSGSTATFTPSSTLAAGSLFTATITTAATDLAGNALAANHVWSFTTGAAPDTTPPTITATNPANNVTGAPFNQAIAATFSKGMNPVSVTNAGFTLTGPGGAAVSGTVSYVVSGSTATFTSSAPLAGGSLFTATVTTAATDLAGNALAANYVWSFTTGAAADTTPPTITATSPANNVTGVPFNQAIAATFSKGMNPASVTNGGFTLAGPGGAAVAGTVTYVVSGSTATFTPSSPLAAGSLFTATITTAVTDLAGNALAAGYVWSFTTGAAPDTTPPTLTATNPANNVTGVPVNQAIAATFSEGMNPASVTNGGFTLAGPGGAAVAGSAAYVVSGSTATFTPSSPLAGGSLFTATITTAATDLAGNALAANYVWSFTTGAAPDTTPPTITATNPADGSATVATTAGVNASFSEAMDATSISSATFQLTGPAGGVIAGTVTYDSTSFIATFTPSASLADSTTYTAAITNSAKDLAGNALASGVAANPWSFTTGATAGPPPVPLGTASLFGGFASAAGMTNQGTSTVINGNIGTSGGSAVITGFHDSGAGCTYSETAGNSGLVNGAIDTGTPSPTTLCANEGTANTSAIAGQVASDAANAYADLVAFSGGLDVSTCPGCGGGSAGELGGRTLVPGIYKSAPATYGITAGDLTLDAQGNANAFWVFQMGTTLTVGTPSAHRSVVLLNGAQAKNVFWQVGTAATINGILGGGTIVGTIISQTAISVSTAGVVAVTTINGRAICLAGPVTLVNTVIDVPGP